MVEKRRAERRRRHKPTLPEPEKAQELPGRQLKVSFILREKEVKLLEDVTALLYQTEPYRHPTTSQVMRRALGCLFFTLTGETPREAQ